MTKDRFLVFICASGILLGAVACGKKGDPFLPRQAFSARVTDLKGEQVKGDILLKGKITSREGLEGARVYYAQYSLENAPCEGCPIEYQGYQAFGAEVIMEDGFSCDMPAKSEQHIYYFRVNLIGPGGTIGPPSDTVKVVVE